MAFLEKEMVIHSSILAWKIPYIYTINLIKVLFTSLHGKGNRITIMTLKCGKRKIN